MKTCPRFLTGLLLAAALALPGFLTGCRPNGPGTSAKASSKYHCPMHPTHVTDGPGECPICNMDLVPIKPAAAAAPSQYHCPMHPTHVTDGPGECPICNMDLVPIKPAASAGAGSSSPSVPGRTLIAVSPEKQQTIGLRTEPVALRALTLTLRVPGTLQHDETRLARIAPRFAGWVRQLHVNFTGQPVAAGQPLLTVYSPELLATENDYLIAWRQDQQAESSPTDDARRAARQLLESARRRLELWQISPEEIRALEQRGTPSDELLIRSPRDGHVITRNVAEGGAFTAGETLYEIGDLAHLWVRASIPESELLPLAVGQTARVVFPYPEIPAQTSRIAFISPHIDPRTRRGEARLDLPNPRLDLRPEMWVQVDLELPLGEHLAVPTSALIDTGTRTLAFVRREDDHLEPREVRLGRRTPDYVEVLEGLAEDEAVVTRALFLIDAESQLKAAIAAMTGEGSHAH